MRRIPMVLAALAVSAFLPLALQAQNAGQADLDTATDAQLTAETLGELERVIKLAEAALDKGLDKGQQAFAKQLLAATLYQHANRACSAIFERDRPAAPVAADPAVGPEGPGKGQTLRCDAARRLSARSPTAGRVARRRRQGGRRRPRRGHQAAPRQGRSQAAGQGLRPARQAERRRGPQAGRLRGSGQGRPDEHRRLAGAGVAVPAKGRQREGRRRCCKS